MIQAKALTPIHLHCSKMLNNWCVKQLASTKINELSCRLLAIFNFSYVWMVTDDANGGKKDVKITFWSSNNQKFINWMRKPATIMSEWVRAFNFNCTSAMKWSRKFKAENNGASFYSMRLLLLLRPVYLLFRSTLCSEPVIKNGNAIGIE